MRFTLRQPFRMTEVVATGYDSVYTSWQSSALFHEIRAREAVNGSVAEGFEHLNFADVAELRRIRNALDLGAQNRIIDLEETLGWWDRLVAAYSAVIAAEGTLRLQLGNDAMDALLLEMSLTLQRRPYPRRVFVVARSP
jgi:hypothetical protein